MVDLLPVIRGGVAIVDKPEHRGGQTVGSLCFDDYKGANGQYVDQGKLVYNQKSNRS